MVSGAAFFAEKLAKHFSEHDHEVLVLTASDRPDPYQLDQSNLSVVRCRSFHNPFRTSQRFSLWPHTHVLRYLTKFAPDLIHLHDPFQFAISSLYFSRSRNIPVVLTIHQLPWFVSAYLPTWGRAQLLSESLLWCYARWILKRCAGLVAGTQTTANVIYSNTGIRPQIISSGLDLSIFSPDISKNDRGNTLSLRLGIPEEVPIILHLGRLDRDKQVDRVVLAAAIAMQQTTAHLLIVGDGTEKLKLMQLCTQLGIGERSHFPGFISAKNDLAALYQRSSVFVTASEIETQGIVLLEAAACALPIVTVQATCLHEIVHEGVNGFLLCPGDQEGMAECLSKLIENPKLAHEMGQKGRQLVESHAEENTFAAYKELYQTIVQERSGIYSPKEALPGHSSISNTIKLTKT